MWAKRIVRVLAAVYVVGGLATLLAPESMGRFTRWFGNLQPLYMRLDALLIIALRSLPRTKRVSGGGTPAPAVAADLRIG